MYCTFMETVLLKASAYHSHESRECPRLMILGSARQGNSAVMTMGLVQIGVLIPEREINSDYVIFMFITDQWLLIAFRIKVRFFTKECKSLDHQVLIYSLLNCLASFHTRQTHSGLETLTFFFPMPVLLFPCHFHTAFSLLPF